MQYFTQQCCYHLHFSGEDTDTEKLSNFPEVTQLLGDESWKIGHSEGTP